MAPPVLRTRAPAGATPGAGAFRSWLDPGRRAALLAAFGAADETALGAALLAHEPALWLRRMPRRETFLVQAPGGARLVVKRAEGDARRERWYERLRGRAPRSPGRRECENLAALLSDGVAVPRPLAWLETGSGGRERSAAVMEYVEHDETLRQRLARAGRAERDDLAETLLALVVALHGHGWYHRDLYVHHVVVERGGTLVLLDVGRARREPRPRRRWLVKDLAALLHALPPSVGASERMRFLDRWLERTGRDRADRRGWARRIVRKQRRFAAHEPRWSDPGRPEVPDVG